MARWHTTGILRWFVPGMRVKRWIALLIAGITLIGLGGAYLLRDLYAVRSEVPWFYYVTLQFIPRWGRGLLFSALGLAAVALGLVRLS